MGVRRQRSRARLAASTAASASTGPHAADRATTVDGSAGSTDTIVSPTSGPRSRHHFIMPGCLGDRGLSIHVPYWMSLSNAKPRSVSIVMGFTS